MSAVADNAAGRYVVKLAIIFGFVTSALFCFNAMAADENKASEVGSKSSFFPSYQEEKRSNELRLAQELEATLEQIPGVQKARIHISLASEGIWRDDKQSSAASVVLLCSAPDKIKTDDIKMIVAGASNALDAEDVKVFEYQTTHALQSSLSQSEVTLNNRIPPKWKTILAVVLLIILAAASGFLTTVFLRRWQRIRK